MSKTLFDSKLQNTSKDTWSNSFNSLKHFKYSAVSLLIDIAPDVRFNSTAVAGSLYTPSQAE